MRASVTTWTSRRQPLSKLPTWPPQGEPVYPTTVAARLDQFAYSPAEYRLVAHTVRHALTERGDAFYVVDLVDGHEVTWYTTEDSAWRAWAVLERRDEQGDDQ